MGSGAGHRFGPKVGDDLAYECVACEEPCVHGEDRSGKIGDVLYEAGESRPACGARYAARSGKPLCMLLVDALMDPSRAVGWWLWLGVWPSWGEGRGEAVEPTFDE